MEFIPGFFGIGIYTKMCQHFVYVYFGKRLEHFINFFVRYMTSVCTSIVSINYTYSLQVSLSIRIVPVV